MFGDIVHFQKLDLGLMPLTAVDGPCTETKSDGTVGDAAGVAYSVWPAGKIQNCGNAVKNVTWSQTMMDGSKVKAMESAASYQGSTNPDLTFAYGVDMDFMGCTVLNEAGNKNAGKHWVAVTDSRCTSTGSS